jgi:serine/threonine protein kinase
VKATAQIFLSYAREDREKVEKLYQDLSDAGFKPWMDKKDILPGEDWKFCIQKAIQRSDFFLVCLSANSVSRRGFLQKEIRDALDIWQEKLESDIYLIPARLEDCEVPESLRRFQWVNLFEEDGWTRLVEAIQEGMKRQGEAIKPPVQKSIPSEPHPVDEKPSPRKEMPISSEEDAEREPAAIMPIAAEKVILKKYKILKALGRGALGNVYLAKDIGLKRKVAIKHLRPEYATDEEALERFRREARTIASLRHPNIAIVYGLEQENGQSYIILEHAEKGTLADFLAKEGPPPITQAIDLTNTLCLALAAVHRQGIFHRDIKPANILLIKPEDIVIPKLSDFGLSSASKSGFYLGTLAYAPPEQLSGDPVDARSDVYSLGVVLYEMLIGEPPFTRSNDEIVLGDLEKTPPSLRNIRKEILPSLEKIVFKALAYKPEDRYQTTQEMAKDLEVACQEELEKEEQVRNLYTQADQCIRSQDWPMVIKTLEAVSVLNPNYEDTAQRLAKARKQMTLDIAYKQGLAAFGRGDWSEAKEKFKKILEIDSTYRDTADKLNQTEKQIHLLSLYTEARHLEEMGKWAEATQRYAQIIAAEPGYEDVPQRLARAGEKNRLKQLYDQANALFNKKKWQEASRKFYEVLALDAQYEDAASKAKEADKHARSQRLCAEGMEFFNKGEWERAIHRFEEIRRSDPGYEGLDVKLAEAEGQRKLQDLLDEGLACRGRKDWQGAIEKFTQLLSENPEHPTAEMLLEEAKQRQAREKTRAKGGEENPIKAWWTPQHPTVKAAWIGATATLLVALCGLLGGDFTLEIVRNLLGTNLAPTPTVSALTATSTSTSTPTPSPVPTSTPYPAPALVSPGEGTSITKGQDVKLEWKWERNLEENEFFEVRIRLKGQQKFDQMDLTKMSYQFVPASKLTQIGTYEWQVTIVSLSGEEKGTSQIRSFEVR